MDAVLQIQNLTKTFGKRTIINNVSFDVYAGEVFGFLGPNGAGKTTTIKMVMGFLKPDAGEIVINHINIKKNYEKAMANLGGIVENPEMYKELSGLMNLEMYARLHDGVSRQRIDQVVEMVGMTNRIHEKVKRYSLGMKQRIGLAQALVHKPRVLILDEPTNGLDPAGIKELRDILKHLAHEENIAVIVSSHMLSEMELMCDRVGIISNGSLIGVRPIGDLLAQARGEVIYRFTVDNAEKAAPLLAEDFPGAMRDTAERQLEMALAEEQVPAVTAALVTKGFSVYGIQKAEISLEEAFMDITGGGNTIA